MIEKNLSPCVIASSGFEKVCLTPTQVQFSKFLPSSLKKIILVLRFHAMMIIFSSSSPLLSNKAVDYVKIFCCISNTRKSNTFWAFIFLERRMSEAESPKHNFFLRLWSLLNDLKQIELIFIKFKKIFKKSFFD